jgi:hypothetical protein
VFATVVDEGKTASALAGVSTSTVSTLVEMGTAEVEAALERPLGQ